VELDRVQILLLFAATFYPLNLTKVFSRLIPEFEIFGMAPRIDQNARGMN
jgi:hypothetical protein